MSDGRGSILFVCTGNVCRSPYLEWGLRAALASARGPVIRLTSAGVAPLLGHPMSSYLLERLQTRGIDASEFRARALTEGMVARADVVLTASREHRGLIVRQMPAAATRTFTVLQFARLLRAGRASRSAGADLPALVTLAQQARGPAGASTEHDDIEDPWQHSRRVYARSAAKMDEVLEEILEHLVSR
ncbi:low molecular weight phosphatase family protein [Microbacterium sp. LWS13-1.2]|uniref:Low molecular weight phosphatase family protein n=1 Tax=Microbacterium sp. LWS13-1.2 TaxID=3135264 RepID=A0AAU6SDM4_9MICO